MKSVTNTKLRRVLVGECGRALAVLGVAWVSASCTTLQQNGRTAKPIPAAFTDSHPLAYAGGEFGTDAIVRITTPHVSCTGTLIAEDQVLTAHHCLARRDAEQRYLNQDVEVREIRVELGGDYLPWGEIGVRAIVAPPCGYAAGVGDIAVLVLSTRIPNAPTLNVKLDSGPREGSHVEPVGFGRCRDSEEGIRRHHRAGGEVDLVSLTQFQLEAAICPGDSGGPGVDEHQAVIGVISQSAMDGREQTRNRTEFTRIDRWADVLANAQRISEGENAAELPPVGGCDETL